MREPLRQRYTRGEQEADGTMVDLNEPIWANGSRRDEEENGREDEKEVYVYTPLEVKKGSLVLFHGNLMHQSGANRSQKDRAAYTFSIVEGKSEVPSDSYIRKEEMGRL